MGVLKVAALAVWFATALMGCEGRITAGDFERIQTGMTRADVVRILGEPDETAAFGVGNLSGEAATWSAGDDFITVQFVNNKVFGKQASIGKRQES